MLNSREIGYLEGLNGWQRIAVTTPLTTLNSPNL